MTVKHCCHLCGCQEEAIPERCPAFDLYSYFVESDTPTELPQEEEWRGSYADLNTRNFKGMAANAEQAYMLLKSRN